MQLAAVTSLAHILSLSQLYDVLLAAGGVVVLAAGVKWWRGGARDPLYGSPIRANSLGLQHVWLCLAAFLVSLWVGSGVERLFAPHAPESVSAIIGSSLSNIVLVITCVLIGRYTFLGGLRGFGIGRLSAGPVIGYAVAGCLAALTICEGISWLTMLIVHYVAPGFQPPEHTVFQALRDPAVPAWIRVTAIVGAAVLAPMGEELLFRGILQTGLKKIMPCRRGSFAHRWLAIITTAIIFGFMHWGTPQFVPALIALAVILGFLYERTGSLLVPILLHMLFNGRSLLWYMLSPETLKA